MFYLKRKFKLLVKLSTKAKSQLVLQSRAENLYFSVFLGFYLEISLKPKPVCFKKRPEVFFSLFQASTLKKSEEKQCRTFDEPANVCSKIFALKSKETVKKRIKNT